MANITKSFSLWNNDGTAFCPDNNTGAVARLMNSDASGTVGTLKASLNSVANASPIWQTTLTDSDTGWYLVQKSTGGAWASINGLSPIFLTLSTVMTSDAASLEDDMDANGNGISDLSHIYLSSTSSLIGTSALSGIEYQNLVDKTANTTFTGDLTLNGDVSVGNSKTLTIGAAGYLDVTGGRLKIGGTAVSASVTAAQISLLKDVNSASGSLSDTSRGLGSNKTDIVASVSITSAYGGTVWADSLSANAVVTLPAIAESNVGIQFLVVNNDATYNVTVSTTGSNKVQVSGASVDYSNIILTKGEAVTIMSDGVNNWLVIGENRGVAYA